MRLPSNLSFQDDDMPRKNSELFNRHIIFSESLSHSAHFTTYLVRVFAWMLSSTLPIIRSQPVLKVEQPSSRPWHNCLVKPHLTIPFTSTWHEKAKPKRVAIDMWQFSSIREFLYAGVENIDVRRITFSVFNPTRILATQWRWPGSWPDLTTRAPRRQ